jgi:tRNA(Ile)-lysidine synthase
MDGNWNSKLKSAIDVTTEWLLSTLHSVTNSKHFWVGYSGGLDSHVLLDLMAKLRIRHAEYQVSAIHVHHGLSKYADEWAVHCEAVCHSLQIPIIVQWVNAEVTLGRSPEEVAREARFKAFASHLGRQDCLLLAHHADDFIAFISRCRPNWA